LPACFSITPPPPEVGTGVAQSAEHALQGGGFVGLPAEFELKRIDGGAVRPLQVAFTVNETADGIAQGKPSGGNELRFARRHDIDVALFRRLRSHYRGLRTADADVLARAREGVSFFVGRRIGEAVKLIGHAERPEQSGIDGHARGGPSLLGVGHAIAADAIFSARSWIERRRRRRAGAQICTHGLQGALDGIGRRLKQFVRHDHVA
jgi:hypothetical protein